MTLVQGFGNHHFQTFRTRNTNTIPKLVSTQHFKRKIQTQITRRDLNSDALIPSTTQLTIFVCVSTLSLKHDKGYCKIKKKIFKDIQIISTWSQNHQLTIHKEFLQIKLATIDKYTYRRRLIVFKT